MTSFNFYYPIQVRYGDLDPQWHLNNAHTVILIEQARTSYLVKLGLWDGVDFDRLGLIVADVHVSYKAPVTLLQQVQVGVRVARIGTWKISIPGRSWRPARRSWWRSTIPPTRASPCRTTGAKKFAALKGWYKQED
jgi:acyl-CoA thioesterase FadM